jgi:hypothetical protein
VHGLHGSVLVQSLFSKFATFQRNRLSIKIEHGRVEKDGFHTDSALFLSSKRNVVVQDVVLVHPDLRWKTVGSPPEQRRSRYNEEVSTRTLTVPASNADETRMHWFASSEEKHNEMKGRMVRAYVQEA